MNRHTRRVQRKKDGSGVAAQLDTAEKLLARGFFDEAAQLYRAILVSSPGEIPALFNLGNLCQRGEALEEAAGCFAKIIELTPGDAEAALALAFVRMDQGKVEDALALAMTLKNRDLSVPLLTRLGVLYREAGKFDEARACLTQAVARDPDHVSAWYGLRTLKKFTAEDPDFSRLQELVKRKSELSADEKTRLGFTLGKACLDLGRDEEAFEHFKMANRLKKESYKTPVSLYEDYASSVIALFDGNFLKKFDGITGSQSDKPIFIVGMPRSGSTLVDQILSSHPDVASVGESKFLAQCIPVYPNLEVPGLFKAGSPSITKKLLDSLLPQGLEGIAGNYLGRISARCGNASRVIDKMLFNYYWVGLLRLVFPQAKIVHTVRNPADIGLSIWQIMFSDAMPWAYDLEDIGRYFAAYKKVMTHWESLFPGAIHTVEYEAMVEDPETQTRRLLEYCGLPFDDRCLKFYESDRQVKTASAGQVRAPVYKNAVGKWERYKEHLGPLLEALKDQ